MEHLAFLATLGWDLAGIEHMAVKWTLFVEEKYWKRQAETMRAGLPHAGS